jgi:hypothetical protein
MDQVSNRDSSRESDEPLRLEEELNDPEYREVSVEVFAKAEGAVCVSVVSEHDSCLYISGEEGIRGKEHSDTHAV